MMIERAQDMAKYKGVGKAAEYLRSGGVSIEIAQRVLCKKSALEERFSLHCVAAKLPPFVREFKFHPVRGWRFDFAWPDYKVAVEIQGGIWTQGRHARGAGMVEDMHKHNEAVSMGWRVILAHAGSVKNAEALRYVERLIRGEQ